MLNCFIFSDYDGLHDFRKQNKTDRIVNIDRENMKLTTSMYIRVMISYVRKYLLYGFRKINTNLLYTHNSYNMQQKLNNLIYSLHLYHFNQNP